MIVRIALFAPDQAAEEREKAWVEELVYPTVRAIPGYADAYTGIDPQSGQGISISFWETEAAALAGEQAVARPMQVVLYQVVHQDPPHSS